MDREGQGQMPALSPYISKGAAIQMPKFRTLDELDVRGKRILVR